MSAILFVFSEVSVVSSEYIMYLPMTKGCLGGALESPGDADDEGGKEDGDDVEGSRSPSGRKPEKWAPEADSIP